MNRDNQFNRNYRCGCNRRPCDDDDNCIICPQGPQGPVGPQGPQGVSGGWLFPTMNFDPETGVLTIRGLEQEIDRVRYDYTTGELILRLYN